MELVVAKHRLAVVLIILWIQVAVSQGAGLPGPRKVDLRRQQWNGDAICYSGFRSGESPNLGIFPTRAEVAEDASLLARHWRVLRVYGADPQAERLLQVIREQKLPVRVMLGIWLTGAPGRKAENEAQLAEGIRLANEYRSLIAAVSIGNEALVEWSDHKMTEAALIAAVERVRSAVHVPITVADDYLYWVKPDAALVSHVDFITLHTYPVWGREDIDTALATTEKNYRKVQAAHPGKTIVLGEVGWPSYTEGDKHVPRAGDEQKQKTYFEQISGWARAHQVTAFLFEAFDESWKGSGTEGHWGLFSEQRKAKPAVLSLYPDRKPSAPTSPTYDAIPGQVAK
jgi:exo-beta-1,3-glucanase (GH17 family)